MIEEESFTSSGGKMEIPTSSAGVQVDPTPEFRTASPNGVMRTRL